SVQAWKKPPRWSSHSSTHSTEKSFRSFRSTFLHRTSAAKPRSSNGSSVDEVGRTSRIHVPGAVSDPRGNAYTGKTTIQDYALLKAAETTKEAGGTHFVVISAADASKVMVGHTASTMNTSVIGQTAL